VDDDFVDSKPSLSVDGVGRDNLLLHSVLETAANMSKNKANRPLVVSLFSHHAAADGVPKSVRHNMRSVSFAHPEAANFAEPEPYVFKTSLAAIALGHCTQSCSGDRGNWEDEQCGGNFCKVM
jgi:hypothetical protein